MKAFSKWTAMPELIIKLLIELAPDCGAWLNIASIQVLYLI